MQTFKCPNFLDANQSPAFWFGDQNNSSVEDIIDNLNKGLSLVLLS
jgi:hypothetical protein